jgi:hypothetical protein
MLQERNNTADIRRLRRASWLALVSLAWLQLLLAGHQFDHVAEYLDDNCHVCVQLDRVDDDAVDSASTASLPDLEFAQPGSVTASLVTRTFQRIFDSRGPPSL